MDDAVLVDPASVAAYLSALFPDLQAIITRGDDMTEDVRERADQLDALWGEVGILHPTVQAAMTILTLRQPESISGLNIF